MDRSQCLVGKTALVTGAARGIGFGAAEALAQRGAAVALVDWDEPALAEASERLEAAGNQILTVTADVGARAHVARAVEAIVERWGSLQIVVNSAAIQPYGTVESTSPGDWDRIIAVNLTGAYLVCHYAIPHLRQAGGGSIVNIASVQGLACQINLAAYVASKGAILALTRAMALDHAGDKIRVNSVCPGSIDTPLLRFAARENKGSLTEDELIEKWGRSHPLGRVGTIEEVGAMVAFLCSDEASFCTGGEYKVDGGLLAKLGVVLPD